MVTPRPESGHLSLRMRRELRDRLELAAKRNPTESRSALAARLIDEGLRMDAHPGIVFRGGPGGRRPGLIGGPDVWEVARVLRDVTGDAERKIARTAELMDLAAHTVRTAAGYYAAFTQEIDDWIAEVDREADEAAGV
jgi:hypothetical protein